VNAGGRALIFAAMLCAGQSCFAEEPPDASSNGGGPKTPPVFGLVIGNRDYQFLPSLSKTDSDAMLMAKLLSSLDIDTVVRVNLQYAEMFREISNLGKRAKAGSPHGTKPLVIVYFSGHGFTSNGRQYIAGLDANPDTDDLKRHSVALDSIIDTLTPEAILVAFIDACRSDFGSAPIKGQSLPGTIPIQSAIGVTPPRSSETKGLSDGHLSGTVQASSDYLVSYANRLGAPVLGYMTASDLSSPFSDGLRAYLDADYSVQLELDLVRKFLSDLNIQHDAGSETHMNGEVYLKYSSRFYQNIKNEWARINEQSPKRDVQIFVARYLNGPFVSDANLWLASHSK
jgi:caspase domain-containing protein